MTFFYINTKVIPLLYKVTFLLYKEEKTQNTNKKISTYKKLLHILYDIVILKDSK